ncbi:Aryl-phospho-beta-D-glucosidase BglC, GH1 family [Actinacidiphila alni]|uniref:Aryl-phospho-beta-D-glucosidase BglC, GH1 family n=1 Tax=Actinacidiphila alni TaxID=380248 RepID=A0A1I2L909_9ACTN|nr:cellulase family glycosylhydrolase [Actinacidiphila alni]SFF75715.1 Aryl-phospho-beta-D-glucosidase BglC, GH1 family [Actinacidiphila alni]
MTAHDRMSAADSHPAVPLADGVSRRGLLTVGGATAAALALGGVFSPKARAATPAFYAGANLSGLEVNSGAVPGVPRTDYAVPTTTELDYLRAHGIKVVRLPFNWQRMQPALGGDLDATYLGFVTTLVDHAGSHSQSLILDVHTFGSYGPDKIGSSAVTVADFADLWTRLATVFAGRKGVAGYDLMNEPNAMPDATVWPTAAQAAVDAIRAVDKHTAIFCEGDHWSSAASWQAVNGALAINDPGKNLVYSAHVYFDRDSSGIHFDWPTEVAAGDALHTPPAPLTTDIGVQRITGFADWLVANGHYGHIGEVGTANTDPNWLTTLDKTLAFCRTKGIGVTYWAAGAWFRNYPMGIEQQADGRDTVQMAVLEKYTGAAAPTMLYLSGPQRGAKGKASTAFTADYRGYHTSALTIVPTDNAAGGTFSPASLTMPAGFNGLATFTYKAPGTATYTIGCTNSSGLSDPTPLGYSTRTDPYSTLDPATVLNVLATQRLYSPYIGNAVTLRRASDGATKNFGFTATDAMDTAAISAWAGTSAVNVVTLYDQGPGGRHAGPVVTSNKEGSGGTQLPASTADYPQLVLGGLNDSPVLRFAGNRMDAVSPIDGLTGFTCFTVAKPTTEASMNRLLSWHLTQYLLMSGGAAGTFQLTGETDLDMGIDPSAWHIYAVRWAGGGTLSTYVDGVPIATATAQTSKITFQYDNHVNIGYFRWYPNVYYGGDVWGMFPFSAALSDAQMSGFWSALSSATGIPV